MIKILLSPSKPVSAGAIVGLIFFLLLGIVFAVLIGNVLSENDAPLFMKVFFYIFITMWIVTVLLMLIYHIVNLKRAKGLSLIEVNPERESSGKIETSSPIKKLRDLEVMKKEGLITEEEYKLKRKQLINENW